MSKFVPGLLLIVGLACAEEETFPELGTNLAGPIDVAVSSDNERFYVLNGDLDRTYNKGSILALDMDGKKLAAVSTPRLGRSLAVLSDRIVATFNKSEGDAAGGSVEVYNLDDPTRPRVAKSWELDCAPINAVAREGYAWFAVTCTNGSLWIGEFAEDLAQSKLRKVRNLGRTHRAVHLDTKRNLLYAFVGQLGSPRSPDRVLEDRYSYDEDFNAIEGPNEIPDLYENTAQNLSRRKSVRSLYRFLVYDLKTESEKDLPFLAANTDEAEREFRWLYFQSANFDGTPDDASLLVDTNLKYYRTNFHTAQADPDGSEDRFFISQRGRGTAGSSPYANHVLQVDIIGDPALDADGNVPFTNTFMRFTRVWGFKGDQNHPYNYTSDFEIARVKGARTILVNNFRDLALFDEDQARFSVAGATLDDFRWFGELASTDPGTSYYQVAMSTSGRAISTSFYDGSVILLDVNPGADITKISTIK